MRIDIPNDIKSEYEGYNLIVTWLNTYKHLSGSEIIFDFTKVTFLEANLSALIGTIFEILESNGNKVSLINMNNGIETILRKNAFLVPFGFDKINDRHDTVVTYMKFMPNNNTGFQTYLNKELLSKPQFPKHSEKLGKEIIRNIFEIYENARTHGKCVIIYILDNIF